MFMPFMPLMDEDEEAFFGGGADAALSAAKASDAEVLEGGPRRSLIWLVLRPVAPAKRPAKEERSLPPDLGALLPPKREARPPRPLEAEEEDPPPPKRPARAPRPPRPEEEEDEDPPPPKREARPPRPLEALLPPPPPRRPITQAISTNSWIECYPELNLTYPKGSSSLDASRWEQRRQWPRGQQC